MAEVTGKLSFVFTNWSCITLQNGLHKLMRHVFIYLHAEWNFLHCFYKSLFAHSTDSFVCLFVLFYFSEFRSRECFFCHARDCNVSWLLSRSTTLMIFRLFIQCHHQVKFVRYFDLTPANTFPLASVLLCVYLFFFKIFF